MSDLRLRHAFAEAVAREAGWLARRYFDDPSALGTRLKGFQDYLTVADGEVEALLRKRISEAFPDDGFLGEESGGRASRRLWIVDPIDGTANFARGELHWCVSIGYVEDGEPRIGVIEMPVLCETYSARAGQGAYRNGQRIRVAETADMRMASIEVGWSARRPVEDYLRLVEGVMRAGGAAKRSASGALGICWAASGRTDGYLETHINSWDVAAGLVIATEAGAAVNDFFAGDALEKGNAILVATPPLAAGLAELMGVEIRDTARESTGSGLTAVSRTDTVGQNRRKKIREGSLMGRRMTSRAVWALLIACLVGGIGSARADGNLTLYCGVNEEFCRAMVAAFEAETGIKVAMTRKSSGEIYAQLKAESANPKGDVWWGGTGDPHMQAAEEGLTEEYKSPKMGELHPWAVKAWDESKGRTIGVYSGALGFGYNLKALAAKKLPEPKCWADLIDERFKDEVQVADPNASGTAYTLLATMVQLMGEDKGFEYLKKLHRNVNQYTKSGAAPAKATSLGETTVGIVFMHDMISMGLDNPDLKTVAPCEGTGYEIGSMSIVKGAKNLDSAKKFYDFALTAKAQELGAANKQLQVPANKAAQLPPAAPRFETIKLIDYDFRKYGSSAERKRLLAKWDAEVKSLPK